MVRILVDEPPEQAAAWIALLALCSSVPEVASRSDEDVYLLNSKPNSARETVQILARREKPLHCTATVNQGHLSLACRALTAREAEFHASWTKARENDPKKWLHLRARVGEALLQARILCIGRGEALVVSTRAIECWQQQYYPMLVSVAAGEPDEAWSTHQEVPTLAGEVGADYVFRFASMQGGGFVVPLPSFWSLPGWLARMLRSWGRRQVQESSADA